MTDGVSALSFRFAADTRSACRAGRPAGFEPTATAVTTASSRGSTPGSSAARSSMNRATRRSSGRRWIRYRIQPATTSDRARLPDARKTRACPCGWVNRSTASARASGTVPPIAATPAVRSTTLANHRRRTVAMNTLSSLCASMRVALGAKSSRVLEVPKVPGVPKVRKVPEVLGSDDSD